MLKAIFVYVSTIILVKATPFLLSPIMASKLSPDEFGRAAIFLSVAGVATFICGFRSDAYVLKETSEKGSFNIHLLLRVSFKIACLLSIVVIPLTYLFESSYGFVFYICAIWAGYLFYIFVIFLTQFQARGEVKYFSLFNISYSLLLVMLSLILLYGGAGWYSRPIGFFSAAFIFAIIGIGYISKKQLIGGKSEKLLKIWNVSSPFFIQSLNSIIINVSDKLILAVFTSTVVVGVYSLAVTMGLIASLLVEAVDQVWRPFLYKEIQAGRDDYKKVFSFLFIGIIASTSVVCIVMPYVFTLLFSDEYLKGVVVAQIIAVGAIFKSLSMLVLPLISSDKNKQIIQRRMLVVTGISVLLLIVGAIHASGVGVAIAVVCNQVFISMVVINSYFKGDVAVAIQR